MPDCHKVESFLQTFSGVISRPWLITLDLGMFNTPISIHLMNILTPVKVKWAACLPRPMCLWSSRILFTQILDRLRLYKFTAEMSWLLKITEI